tara:strand:- start:6621 stop:6806 length:186 start_codon:yes stop_codon:yes gene_type:complete
MAINRDQFAGDVYLRLLEANPHKQEEWLRQESIRQADEFLAALKASQPTKPKQPRRQAVNV